MCIDAKKYVENCVHCATVTQKPPPKSSLLHAPIEAFNDTIVIDHLYLGKSRNNNKIYTHVLTIVERLTNFTWLSPMAEPTVLNTIEALEKYVCIFGAPSKIVCDAGPVFTSHAFQQFCDKNEINLNIVASGRHESVGSCERTNGRTVCYLRRLHSPESWAQVIGEINLQLNTEVSTVHEMTPFELVFGITPRNFQRKLPIEVHNEPPS